MIAPSRGKDMSDAGINNRWTEPLFLDFADSRAEVGGILESISIVFFALIIGMGADI